MFTFYSLSLQCGSLTGRVVEVVVGQVIGCREGIGEVGRGWGD